MGGHILLAEEIMSHRVLTRARLNVAHYNVTLADRLEDAHQLAVAEQPDLAIIGLSDTPEAAFSLIRTLKSDPLTSEIEIVALTSNPNGAANAQALAAGADDVLSRSTPVPVLQARIRNLMRVHNDDADLTLREDTREALGFAEPASPFEMGNPSGPGTIALVTAKDETAVEWRDNLSSHLRDHIKVLRANHILDAKGDDLHPDVYVIEATLQHHHDGLELIAELRSRVGTRTAGIIAVMDPEDIDGAISALDLGANGVIFNPPSGPELVERIRTQLRRKARSDRLRRQIFDGLTLAVTDPLTGLKNRRYALSSLTRIAEHAKQSGQSFAVMILDLDRFKRVNDTYGHQAGDAVLTEAARRITGGLRTDDIVARLGGEEFLVIMPDTTPKAAAMAGERLRQLVEAVPFAIPGRTEALSLTVSVGIAMGKGAGHVEALVEQADRALYSAKADGRNLVTMSRPAA